MVEMHGENNCCIQREVDIRILETQNINRNCGRRKEEFQRCFRSGSRGDVCQHVW